MTGNTMSVSTVATSKPPLKAIASGLQNTDPIRGIMPKTVSYTHLEMLLNQLEYVRNYPVDNETRWEAQRNVTNE